MADEFNPGPRLADRLEALDTEVRAWAQVTRRQLIQRVLSLNLRERALVAGDKRLRDSIGFSLRRKDGDIEAVAFSFPRKGVFLERGVGRYRPAGSTAAGAAARPWLQPTLPPAIDILATILSEEFADVAAAELRILVPGVIDTTISK